MEIRPLHPTLGAELVDFDLKRPLTPAEQQELRDVFCEYHLLVIHAQDQGVTADDQTRFTGNFGPVHVVKGGALNTYVTNQEQTGTGLGRLLWHFDGTYGQRPGIATCLWGEEISGDSSPTIFLNAVRVLEELPADLRARIEPLHAAHVKDTFRTSDAERRRTVRDIDEQAEPGRFIVTDHPIVYPLPHMDRSTLLVDELTTSHVVELPEDESEALLQDLFARLYAEENVYAHEWSQGDVIFWDNLALQHSRPLVMGEAPRHLRRQSLDGWYSPDGVVEWVETAVKYAGVIE